jgi:hypothetical protein
MGWMDICCGAIVSWEFEVASLELEPAKRQVFLFTTLASLLEKHNCSLSWFNCLLNWSKRLESWSECPENWSKCLEN